jgi:pimeloyl-ACP methyl ester carboxylesterase
MPPILLIHGAFSNARHFDGWARFFAHAGFECHAPSLPGHDPSDPTALASLGMDDYLAALRRDCVRFSTPPILIGHSMGGLLAQLLAAGGPCAALVCVASAPPWILTPQLRALPFIAPLLPAILLGRPIHLTADIIRNVAIHELPEDEQRELIPTFVGESGKANRSMILGLVRIAGRPFDGPVLCVSGGQDRIISNRMSGEIARTYGARHEIFPNRDHWLIARSAEHEVAGAVLRWLRDNALADGIASEAEIT